MFRVTTSHETIAERYPYIYDGVVGAEFPTLAQAQQFLSDEGWGHDPMGTGSWVKDGPRRMCGQIGVSLVHYVDIEEVM